MKRMIDADKFLDKLLYIGYMDEQKSEVEEVANTMTEEAYTKDEVLAMLTELQLEIEDIVMEETLIDNKWANGLHYSEKIIQQKMDKMQESEVNE